MSDQENGGDERDRRSRRYAAAIVALAAVIIGLCSVVGEALVPRTLPPQDARSWAAFLLAMALFTVIFAATTVLTGFLDRITRLLARARCETAWRCCADGRPGSSPPPCSSWPSPSRWHRWPISENS
ncbi:hypothetical protein [Actinomadura sp. CNU-125]|uniref:hypothetical protein n=1 Tax=Actinomadura sp. CNU-125 TaxID=1904961 RepID=UPI001177C562|nr:hypothetical protein [Actinomadura sp. CNU-125]